MDKPVTKRFRKTFVTNRLPDDSLERQGRIALIAWQQLGGTEAAALFLNHHDEALGGRPLDVATASGEGMARVEQAIAARAAAGQAPA